MKTLQGRLDALEGQLTAAERAAASSEAQKNIIAEEKAKFQKQAKVCFEKGREKEKENEGGVVMEKDYTLSDLNRNLKLRWLSCRPR